MSASPEPFRIVRSQNEIPEPDRRAWIVNQSIQAKDSGAVLCRITCADDDPGILLFEAWSEYPDDQGAPRWAAADPQGEAS